MKVQPLIASRRYWCVRCGVQIVKDSGMCVCHLMDPPGEPYMFPLGVEIHGNVVLGEGVQICEPADINGTGSSIVIGDGVDIAAFVTINCADSHARCIGLSAEIERREILIGSRVFIGQGATILGGCEIGDGSVIGAGAVLKGQKIPPDSRVNAAWGLIEPGYYAR